MKIETQYTEFVSALRDTIFRLALSIVNDSAEAEDIVQDVFEKVWRTSDKILESSYPRAYVCRIAHNMAIDRQRARVRRQTFSLNSATITHSETDANSEIADMASITREIISTLAEKQRLAIHLRDIEGYEIDEIAEVLNTDETNVRMNLSRARKTVREELLKRLRHGVE